MSRPALIRQSDVARIARGAREAGCVAEVEINGVVIRLRPDTRLDDEGERDQPKREIII